MNEGEWLAEAAYKNWVSVFTLFKEFTFKEKGVIAGKFPHIPLIFVNNVFQTDLTNQEVDQTIELIISKYREEKIDFSWSITPFTNPNNFDLYLKKYGFIEVGEVPHMALLHSNIDKNQFDKELHEADLKIRKIDINNLDLYMNPFTLGFGLSENIQLVNGFNKFLLDFLRLTANDIHSGLFLGYVDDKPVSTALGIIANDVMGIYNIATIPEYRKRGYGRLMTTDLIIRGINAKVRGSILQSSEMGKGVYEKLGFVTKYYQKQFKLEEKL
ncbi:MAG: hypothetical protein HeimC2_00900 [Candidatus Heimdallarchaeota archaeon LC_2]|nr:MAG: hypothetical protein HeimC2_00900 [Candidatus Heimdallarchaeota archaeon LC_2]